MIRTLQSFQENPCICSISTAVLNECALACLEEIYAFPFPFSSTHYHMFTNTSNGKRGVKRDLMLCISCPVMSACQDIHQPKVSSFLDDVLTRQNKQSRHIFRLAIDIQNLSIFWVLYPGWFYKVIVEAHKIYGLEIMFAKPWVILEISDFGKICCFLGQDLMITWAIVLIVMLDCSWQWWWCWWVSQ